MNFDWDHISDVLAKVEEELQEVKDEMKLDQTSPAMKEEIGDLLFSVAQLARHLDIDPEDALKQANLKFVKRINLVEDQVRLQNKQMNECPTAELEDVWQTVKQQLKKGNS